MSDISPETKRTLEALIDQIEFEYLAKIPQGDMDQYSAPVRDSREKLAQMRQVLRGEE